LGIPIVLGYSSWDGDDYVAALVSAFQDLAAAGAQCGLFGDLDIQSHRRWLGGLCDVAGVKACFPLWGRARWDVLEEFLSRGFKAMIIAVECGVMDGSLLGRVLDLRLAGELEAQGIDVLGERGEYHTVVFDGPIFSAPVDLYVKEKFVFDGYLFLDVLSRSSGAAS